MSVKKPKLPFTQNALLTTYRKYSSQIPWGTLLFATQQAANEIIGAGEEYSGIDQVLATTHSLAA